MSEDVTARVTRFIDDELRPSGMTQRVTATTSLLQSGLLDSLRTASLLNFIRTEFGVTVAPRVIDFRNFETPARVADMVGELLAEDTRRDARGSAA